MANKTLASYAAATAVAAVLSLATTTAGSAAPRWHTGAAVGAPHWRAGPAIGVGVAGLALGAAMAGAASPYDGYSDYAQGDYYAPTAYYGYAPGAYYDVVPGVATGGYYDLVPNTRYGLFPFSGPYGSGWRRPGQCRFTIRGC